MCMKSPKLPKVAPPTPPPAPTSSETPPTPVIDEGFGEGDQISAKRKGRLALTIPLGGLNIPGR